MYPKYLVLIIDEAFQILSNINSRVTPVELVHEKLDDVNNTLKKLINHRDKYLKEENISVINLSTIVHSKTLTEDHKIMIKINNVVVNIAPAYGVEIENNFNAYRYSINKVGKIQELQYAHYDDARLHNLVYIYKSTKGNYKYKIGNRVELKPYGGVYKIIYIDQNEAIITCKKWQNENKKNRKIKVSDIKGLATNKYNSLSYGS